MTNSEQKVKRFSRGTQVVVMRKFEIILTDGPAARVRGPGRWDDFIGCEGTIVRVHKHSPLWYEVEFYVTKIAANETHLYHHSQLEKV